jgi:hypothetical protein
MKRKIVACIATALLIIVIGVSYIWQLNKTVTENILQNIGELAEHDQSSIQSNIEETWEELEYIGDKFASYRCSTIEEMETQMNVECANSMFYHIYLVAADGKVYTDKFLTYDPSKEGQSGRIDLLPLFADGGEQVVQRFDDRVPVAGLTKETILYGVALHDIAVDGVEMVGLVGITDIDNIQDQLSISSFLKDGKSRGYSSVLDMSGEYIVSMDDAVYLNDRENFLTQLEAAQESELTADEVREKMENQETFNFRFTNEDGIERIVCFMPFPDVDID